MVDTGAALQEYSGVDYIATPRERMPTPCARRELFKHAVREQVRDIENVLLRGDHRFLEYRTDDRGTVDGVR